MHELGHNLGLEHGGFEETNDKPNYLSIMNYTYLLYGIGPKTGDKIHERHYIYFGDVEPKDKCKMVDSICIQNYKMDFSHGGGQALDESNIFESEGIGHGASNLDWDRDKDSADLQQPYVYNVNQDCEFEFNTQTGRNECKKDINGNNVSKIDIAIRDYNDWDNLKLQFRFDPQGEAVFDVEEGDVVFELEEVNSNFLLNDIQPTADEEPIFNRP